MNSASRVEPAADSSSSCPFARLPGEEDFLAVSRSDGPDGVALSYPVDEDGVPIRCGVFITNYRTVILPMRGSQDIIIPHMMLESWELERHTMNATQRAAFPQSHPLVQTAASPATAAGGTSGGGNPVPVAYTLTMVTKYLWNVKIMFQDERQASAARKLVDSLRPNHLSKLPAFELYRAIVSDSRQQPSTVGDDAAATANSEAAETTSSHVNFGWNIYDTEAELHRQLCVDPSVPMPSLTDEDAKFGPGIDLRNWFRTTRIAQEDNMYGRSPTYPFLMVTPNSVSDPALVECIYSRSRGRIPGISFVHFGTGAVLARCSQPISKGDPRKDGELCNALVNAGYTLKSSKPREARPLDPVVCAGASNGRSVAPPPSLIDAPDSPVTSSAVVAVKRSRTLMVADCRPYAAAYGNQTLGGGFESGPAYDFCKVKFHGIDNIHGVSKSFNKLKSIIHNFNGKFPKESFYDQLHDSQWLHHIQRVLMCSLEIAEGLDRGESFLVHCTDGWDRTSQCTSIAMMLLDPFYRTTLGFCILIEKEFCSFGHKFAERCNHMLPGDTYFSTESGVSASDIESQQTQQSHKLQPSPIFVQWLDCIFQIIRQFPNKFEFTSQLLEQLAADVYSCLYGTFLANSEKERTFEGVKLKTSSLWTRVLDAVAREKEGIDPPFLLNTHYDAQDAWRFVSKSENCGIQFLPISCSTKRLVFWEEHYLRYDSDALSIRVIDKQLNARADAHRRKTLPYHCEALEAYLNQIIENARCRRIKDVAYMEELLQRLQVQRPPPVSATQQANTKSTIVDAKSCWQCHAKFGFFASKEYCSRCVAKAPICSKCIRSTNGKKLCMKCLQMTEILDDE